MNVALLCGTFAPERDGVSDYVARLQRALQARGVHATVVADPAGGVRRPAAAVRRLDADVVHVQFAPSAFAWRGRIGLLPLLLGERQRLLVTLHEYDWWTWAPAPLRPLLARTAWPAVERRRWWDRETGLLTVRAQTVVVTNRAHLSALHARLPDVPAVHIPIGSNLPTAGSAPQRDPNLLVFFGFVHPVKGIRYLLKAVGALQADRPDVRLVLAGGIDSLALRDAEADAYRREVEDLVARHCRPGSVELTGWLEPHAASALLARAAVAVLPFTAGATTKSGSLLACADHGVPLVVTAASPPDPVLVDGRHALLVRPRDATGLRDALGRVLDDPLLAARLAAGARRLAARHDWNAIADAHVRLYRGAVAAAGAKATPRRASGAPA